MVVIKGRLIGVGEVNQRPHEVDELVNVAEALLGRGRFSENVIRVATRFLGKLDRHPLGLSRRAS